MKKLVAKATLGCFAVGLALSSGAAQGQTVAEGPPRFEDAPAFDTPVARNLTPGEYIDPETGALVEITVPVEPILIPFDGVLPDGTIPQPEREAGRPMRPHEDPWIPDGSGYWPPMVDDMNAPQATPVMQSFGAIPPNGLNPPDPDLARGIDYEVCVTNDDFAVYDSCGTELFRRDINDYLGINAFMFDPKVIYDPWANRWVMMYHIRENNPQQSELVVVVTGNSIPFGLPGSDVWFYRFNTVQDGGTGDASWIDYADLGYSNTQLFASGNMFRFAGGFRWARLIVFDKANIYARNAAGTVRWSNLTNADGSTTTTPRSVKQQVSWNEGNQNIDAYFVNSRGGGGNRITFWKVRDAFGANTLTRSDTVVGNYAAPPDAVQPTGERLDTIDCRLMTAIATNDFVGNNGIELFTALNAERSGETGVLLYKFDAVSEALEFESNFGIDGFYYWFASSAADYSGSNIWVFSRTANSAGNEPEIRMVDYNRGVFSSSSQLIKDGEGSDDSFRWGDYFGGQIDWGDYNNNFQGTWAVKMWLYAQYGTNNSWDTWVAASSVFPQGSISSVSPSGTFSSFGPPGGPFSPSQQVYTLSSASGDVGTAYQVESLPSWLSTNKTYAQIWTSDTVTLSINSNANGLGLGTYSDTVVFDECYNGRGQFNRLVELNVRAPDLEITSVDAANGTYNPNDTMPVRGGFRNNGNENIRSFTVDFYLSVNDFISEFDIPLGTRNYGPLNAGDSQGFNESFRVPCVPEGPYYVGAIATVAGDADTSDNVNFDPTTVDIEFCEADFNGDCSVNTQDVLAFLNAWNAGRPEADCNGDRTINTQDVLCFLNLWTGGC